MDEKQIQKILNDFNDKIERVKKKEDSLLEVFQKNIEDFSKALIYLKDKREKYFNQLNEISDHRLTTFEKIREILKDIKEKEKKREQVTAQISELDEKEIMIKGEYNSLLSGIGPKTSEIGSQGMFYNIYETNKKLVKTNTCLKKEELVNRRKDLLEGLKESFEKLETELVSIDSDRKNLDKEKTKLSGLIYSSNKEHSVLQKKYSELIEKVKKVKRDIKAISQDEALILSDYSKYLSGIKTVLEIPKEVQLRFLPVLSRIDAENDLEESDWVIEVEEISDQKDNLINFPKAV